MANKVAITDRTNRAYSRVKALADGESAEGVEFLSYTPDVEADWDAPIPTTVQEALDQLAGRIYDIENP